MSFVFSSRGQRKLASTVRVYEHVVGSSRNMVTWEALVVLTHL